MRPGLKVHVRNHIKFDIIDRCFTRNTDNEANTILLKDSQDLTSISTIYIPPASTINTTLLKDIKTSADDIIILEISTQNISTLTVLKRINGLWH